LSPRKERNRALPLIGLFFAFFLVILLSHLPFWDQPYYWDALGAYYNATRVIYEDGLNPIQGGNDNIGHPPLLFWITAAGWKILPADLFVSHLVIYLITALLALTVFLFGIRMLDEPFGVCAVILLLFMPIFFFESAQMLLDLPMAAFFMAALYCLLFEKWPGFFLAATAMVLTKAYAWVYLPLFWGCFFARRILEKKRISPPALLLLPGAALPLYLGTVYLATRTWLAGDVWMKNADKAMVNSWPAFFHSQIFTLKGLFLNSGLEIFTLLAIMALIVWFIRPAREGKNGGTPLWRRVTTHPRFTMIAFLLIAIVYSWAVLLPLKFSNLRYYLPMYPPLLLLGLYGAHYLLNKRRPAFYVLCGLLLCLLFVRWHWTFGEKVSRVFPRSLQPVFYRLIVYDDARDRRPLSFTGEVTLNYVYWLEVVQKGASHLEKHHEGQHVVAMFPLSGYFIYPSQGIVTKPLPIRPFRFPASEHLKEGDLLIQTSLSIRPYLFNEVRKNYDLEPVRRFEYRGQWMEISRLKEKAVK